MTLERPIAQGETILVVEDDKNIRRVVARFLSDLGYTVLEAGNGKTALALLEGAPEIELLLSDVVLPGGLSGPDIVAAARCQRADLKSLFMSGHVRSCREGNVQSGSAARRYRLAAQALHQARPGAAGAGGSRRVSGAIRCIEHQCG